MPKVFADSVVCRRRIFLLIASLFLGTDRVFLFGQEFADVTLPAFSVPKENLSERGGALRDDRMASSNGHVGSFWNKPIINWLIAEMNPFAPLEFETVSNFYDPFGSQMGTSSSGQQGYRLGWSSFNEFTLLPKASTEGTTGSMKFFQWNSNAKYSQVIQQGALFNGTFWFNGHWWEGPSGIALPSQVDQISTDLEFALFGDGPWSGQIAFHPQFVGNYESRIDRNSFNFDGRAIAMFRASPNWSFVGGVAIWNRVDTLIVPHAGAIWTPNDSLEIRALFPKSRVSYFVGKLRNADFWLYGQYEFKSESWQTEIESAPEYSDRSQFTDQRLTVGLRWDTGRYVLYTEAGYVFDRQVKFANATPSFDLRDTSIFTVGLRY
jgi:hypothetical protein